MALNMNKTEERHALVQLGLCETKVKYYLDLYGNAQTAFKKLPLKVLEFVCYTLLEGNKPAELAHVLDMTERAFINNQQEGSQEKALRDVCYMYVSWSGLKKRMLKALGERYVGVQYFCRDCGVEMFEQEEIKAKSCFDCQMAEMDHKRVDVYEV